MKEGGRQGAYSLRSFLPPFSLPSPSLPPSICESVPSLPPPSLPSTPLPLHVSLPSSLARSLPPPHPPHPPSESLPPSSSQEEGEGRSAESSPCNTEGQDNSALKASPLQSCRISCSTALPNSGSAEWLSRKTKPLEPFGFGQLTLEFSKLGQVLLPPTEKLLHVY